VSRVVTVRFVDGHRVKANGVLRAVGVVFGILTDAGVTHVSASLDFGPVDATHSTAVR